MSAIFFGIMMVICALSMAGWSTAAVISVMTYGWIQPMTGLALLGWVIQLGVIGALAVWMSDLRVES